MKNLLIIAMACYGLSARAQVHGSKNFLYLFNDSVVYADKVRLHPDYDGRWQVRADSRRIVNDRIKFINSDDGFFANTRYLNALRISSFSERTLEGRINLFQETGYTPRNHGWGHRYASYSGRSMDHRMFYNKGFGDLKKVSYRNLQQDMTDHPGSIELLAGYRRSSNSSKLLYSAAGASIIGSLVSLLTAGKSSGFEDRGYGMAPSIKPANFNPALILFGLSAGFALGGYAVQVSGHRKLENAIDVYNR